MSKMRSKHTCNLLSVVIFILNGVVVQCWNINATGGSFPGNVYREATFAYQFQPSGDFVTYFGAGSTTGKCNIMGYWHNGDTLTSELSVSASVKARDTLICTDACTVATCGISSEISPRFDRNLRSPLIDFAGSESILKAADYEAFPDLQMLPALAGAVVPVYNIPELLNVKNVSLVLSRQNIVDVFKGKILFWNDSAILLNNPSLSGILSKVSQPIRVVVRTDGSGTSEIFSTALSLFDPVGSSSPDYSFGATVGRGSNPNWCGSLTDEVQIFKITGCNSALPMIKKIIYLKVVNGNRALKDLNFACDASASNITAEFLRSSPGSGLSVFVSKSVSSSGVIKIQIGYGDSTTIGAQWYKPSVVSLPAGVTLTIRTLQEGGYLNSHFNSTYFVAPQMQSIWISSSASSFQFNVSWHDSKSSTHNVTLLSTYAATAVALAFNNAFAGSVDSVQLVTHTPSTWIEYQVTFSSGLSPSFSAFSAKALLLTNADSVYVTTLMDYNNYPVFYDYMHPRGYGGSGRYTCYLKQYAYKEWSYYTGEKNSGIIAEVFTTPYSIGYSVLTDATASSVPIASMINKAGAIVRASSTSVAYAVMDKGGNLDPQFNAVLADPSSDNAWPIAGFSYYVIRTKTHIGSCSRRIAAMKYLYNYYHSDAVKNIAAALGYSTLPDFIRDMISQKLASSAQCSDGSLALADYATKSVSLAVTGIFGQVYESYLEVYNAVSPSVTWDLISSDDSRVIFTNFSSSPSTVAVVATMLNSRSQKIKYLNNPNISTFAFAHVAAVLIYHLDSFTTCAQIPLRITNEILAGIYTGTITSWDDSRLQQANYAFRACLPSQTINIVVRSIPSDAGSLFIRYLTMISPVINQSYYDQGGNGDFRQFDFSKLLPKNRLIYVSGNNFVDNVVISQDSTFGFYLHIAAPTSNVASYCSDTYCDGPTISPNDFGVSIGLCQQDQSTVINPSNNTYTYDLMTSSAAGCYPIVGTVDISVYAVNNPSTCETDDVIQNKIKLVAFLFNGSAIIKPLNVLSGAPTTTTQRAVAYTSICNQQCNGVDVGYKHCNYRDCSWYGGDFTQLVSNCVASTQRRSVTYVRTSTTCAENPLTAPPSVVLIDCEYVLAGSTVAVGAIFMCALGILVCSSILYLSLKYSHEKVLRRSQLIFIYIFLCGAMLMNLTLLCMYGPNSHANCLLRVWAVNMSSTLMFAPLIMKLHRVDVLFRTLQRGGRRRTISDFTVGLQVCALLTVDVAILVAWTLLDQPHPVLVNRVFNGTLHGIDDRICSSSINGPFEKVMVAWKASLLLFGIIKSIQTWEVPKEISEAKYFAIAIYNIAVIGSFSYFLSVFGTVGIDVVVILRCVGIFISATLSAVAIMIPKLVVIQLSWTEVFLGSASSFKDDYSYTSSTPLPQPHPPGHHLGLPSHPGHLGLGAPHPTQDQGLSHRTGMGLNLNLMGLHTGSPRVQDVPNNDLTRAPPAHGNVKHREVSL